MRKTVRKLFWLWDFDKEEQWLNAMAAKGLALTSVGFCRYEFEDCLPGEYKVCMEFMENAPQGVESSSYIKFLEETGAEHVGTFYRWAYFRKKEAEEFKLFSDCASRAKYLTRIIRFAALLCGLNVYLGCFNLFLLFSMKSALNALGILNLLIAALAGVGIWRLMQKRKGLQKEAQIIE